MGAHRGAIDVESQVGRGTCFTIYLPAASRDTPAEKFEPTVDVTHGTETLLVVDDELSVLNVTKLLLERLGYTVLTATTGAQALDTLTRQGGKIALVLLDMVMPEMPGREAFRRLRALRSDLLVLAVSGYSESKEAQELLREPGVGFLAKPYRIDELAKKIRELLDETAPQPGDGAHSGG